MVQARDFHRVDPHIGTEADLAALSAACRQRGMLLMLDVVASGVSVGATAGQSPGPPQPPLAVPFLTAH